MEPQAILYSDTLDLLFENRNKLYGAYPLRKYYKQRLITAIGIVFGFVLMLASLLLILRDRVKFSHQPDKMPNVVLTAVDLTMPAIKKPLTIHHPAAILARAEVMPQFPGGPEALRRYLAGHLHMPDVPAEPGSQIRVMVKFIVGADGKGINTLQSGGAAFDREVERVISRMPVWKPGMQNGRKAPVYYMLPVNFIIPADY